MVTPLMIEIAIHYYVTADEAGPYGMRDGRETAPAVREQTDFLREAGLLELKMGGTRAYRATAAMKVWIEALRAVPFPVQQWVIPKEAA